MHDIGVPWWVAGGWAIDLALGRITREHGDLEIEILRSDLSVVRTALADFELYRVGDGEVHRFAPGELMPPDWHQTWVLDVDAQEWRVDLMLQPGDVDTWAYRRDASFTGPRSFMVDTTADGIPHLRLHGTLFYKAKGLRPKDQADFDVAAPTLNDDARRWLVDALTRFHPDHPWIHQL